LEDSFKGKYDQVENNQDRALLQVIRKASLRKWLSIDISMTRIAGIGGSQERASHSEL
jgi:hypothetical protein